jgi:hypothetical protein
LKIKTRLRLLKRTQILIIPLWRALEVSAPVHHRPTDRLALQQLNYGVDLLSGLN